MPGEWYPHEKTWLLWPYRTDNWRNNAKPAQAAYAEVVKAIAMFEPVCVGVPKSHMDSAKEHLKNINGVELHEIESDDSWARDTGPTYVINIDASSRKVLRRGIDWKFNAWGEMGRIGDINYFTYDRDVLIAKSILAITRDNAYEADFVLEGGSIHVDGEGTVITTEECLLNPNRNPHLSKLQIEKLLCDYLNCSKVIWLRRGLVADEDTNGHIDNICCFVEPGKVLLSWCDDQNDPQYEICREALDIFASTPDAKGRLLDVVRIPIPTPMYYTENDCYDLTLWGNEMPRKVGDRLAASYVNFYICNGKSYNLRLDS